MYEETGELLYEEPTKQIARKGTKWIACFGIFCFSCAIFLILVFIFVPKKELAWYWFGIPVFLIIYLFFRGILSFIAIFGVSDLKVYEYGMIQPEKSFKQILTGEKKYWEFEDISAVYPNENTPCPRITLLKHNGETDNIEKELIDDLDILLAELEEAGVTINWDEDWIHPKYRTQ